MTKMPFIAFAKRIKASRTSADSLAPPEAVQIFDETAYAASIIASVAAEFNPRFDRSRFFKACGIAS